MNRMVSDKKNSNFMNNSEYETDFIIPDFFKHL